MDSAQLSMLQHIILLVISIGRLLLSTRLFCWMIIRITITGSIVTLGMLLLLGVLNILWIVASPFDMLIFVETTGLTIMSMNLVSHTTVVGMSRNYSFCFLTTQLFSFSLQPTEPHVYIAKTKYCICLSSNVRATIFALLNIHFFLSAVSSLFLVLFRIDRLEWILFGNASSINFVFMATIVLQAIVNALPMIRCVSLLMIQSLKMNGLLKSGEAGTSLVLTEVTSKINFPSELETTQPSRGVCDT
jgi:hypothetical protein